MGTVRTLAEGRYLGLYERDNWEYAERPNADGVVGILAHTPADEIVLVEQYRFPVQARVIEIPAGLVGDEEKHRGEPLADTAGRELLEETGYRAGKLSPLYSGPTSPGMTPELTHLFYAEDLHRESEGGGVDGEDIKVHIVPRPGLRAWLSDREAAGFLIDFKIHASMWLAGIYDGQ